MNRMLAPKNNSNLNYYLFRHIYRLNDSVSAAICTFHLLHPAVYVFIIIFLILRDPDMVVENIRDAAVYQQQPIKLKCV